MRLPRELTPAERKIVADALRAAAAATRVAMASARTHELLSRGAQAEHRRKLAELQHAQDRLASAIADAGVVALQK